MIEAPTKPAAAPPSARVRPATPVKRVAWYWLPALAWIGMVLLTSSDAFSPEHTSYILGVVLTWMFGHVDARTFDQIHFLIRKSAHFAEYAILSALWFRALRVGLLILWRIRWVLVGLAVSLAVAVLDELHQGFMPSRTSSARDVLLDFCGALFAQLVIWYALRRPKPATAES